MDKYKYRYWFESNSSLMIERELIPLRKITGRARVRYSDLVLSVERELPTEVLKDNPLANFKGDFRGLFLAVDCGVFAPYRTAIMRAAFARGLAHG